MLNLIKAFFDKYIEPVPDAGNSERRLQIATAALLTEVMRMDSEIKNDERQVIEAVVRERFSLSDEQAAELTAVAEQRGREATDYYQFTTEINHAFDLAERIRLVEYLWQVALADSHLSHYEDHLIRKISDLLYVPHRDFIAAKLKAREMSQAS